VSISVSPFLMALVANGHVDDVGAETLAGELEGSAGSCRGLEEEIDHCPPAQGGELLIRAPALVDIGLAQVEQQRDLLARQSFDAEQVSVAETKRGRGYGHHPHPSI
jgi:hypothetical protein